MNNDIKPRHSMRVVGPPRRRFEGTERIAIDFSVPEARALKIYVKRNKGRGATRQTVLVDGLELLPGFSVLLKREQQLYAKQASNHPASRAEDQVGKEFN